MCVLRRRLDYVTAIRVMNGSVKFSVSYAYCHHQACPMLDSFHALPPSFVSSVATVMRTCDSAEMYTYQHEFTEYVDLQC